MNGLYGYWDNEKQRVVYIGQSNDIRRRFNEHNANSRYNEQQINKVLQNNPDRYESFIFVEGDFTTDELNELEYEAVEIFKTNRYKYPENEGFNFRDGGKVKEMLKETKIKMSESHKDTTHSEETKKKISESMKGENNPAWKNYARIVKCGFKRGKQNYRIDFNGKERLKQSISVDKLVKWFNENYPDEELVIGEGIKY